MLAISKATRGALGEAVNKARYAGVRTTILVRGRPAAALVSLADLAQLEKPGGASEPPRP